MSENNFPGLRKFTPIVLNLRDPVPSDIDIAQEAKIKPISQVAEEVGLLPAELEMHGGGRGRLASSGT